MSIDGSEKFSEQTVKIADKLTDRISTFFEKRYGAEYVKENRPEIRASIIRQAENHGFYNKYNDEYYDIPHTIINRIIETAEEDIQIKAKITTDVVDQLVSTKRFDVKKPDELVEIVIKELARTQGEEVEKHREYIKNSIINIIIDTRHSQYDPSYNQFSDRAAPKSTLVELANQLVSTVKDKMTSNLVTTNVSNKLVEQLDRAYPDLKTSNPERYKELKKIAGQTMTADVSYQNFIKGNIPINNVNTDKIIKEATTAWQQASSPAKEAPVAQTSPQEPKIAPKKVAVQDKSPNIPAPNPDAEIIPKTKAPSEPSPKPKRPIKLPPPIPSKVPPAIQQHAQNLKPVSQDTAKQLEKNFKQVMEDLNKIAGDNSIQAGIGKKNWKELEGKINAVRNSVYEEGTTLEKKKENVTEQLTKLQKWCEAKDQSTKAQSMPKKAWQAVKEAVSQAYASIQGKSYTSRAEAFDKVRKTSNNKGHSK